MTSFLSEQVVETSCLELAGLYESFGLKPVFEIVTVDTASLFVKLIGFPADFFYQGL